MSSNLPFALIAIDICILKIIDGKLCVFTRAVNKESLYQKFPCIPGGLIFLHESAEETMERILKEKTPFALKDMYVEQLYTFSKVTRDKRSRVVSCAYLALYNGPITLGFLPVTQLKKLAYDHNEIVQKGIDRIKSKLGYTTIIKKLVNNTFTYSELQRAYEVVLNKEIDKRNFRKKFDGLDVLVATGEKKKEGRMRPAVVYKFKKKDIETLKIFD